MRNIIFTILVGVGVMTLALAAPTEGNAQMDEDMMQPMDQEQMMETMERMHTMCGAMMF